tara:strand:- start:324 stop:1436 length:1113 start_codon:yes stop_codon:yes gene_type:complete
MTKALDITLQDLNRRDLDVPDYKVKEVLPEFFRESYPKLITLLDDYYEFEDSDASPSRLLNDLFKSRDITQTDVELLKYIEDELLLGQSYFEGFQDKRAAAKYSNTLYRSKGTKYSIQQFFRTFFGIDPEVIYTKKNVFKVGEVGESLIGPNSQKYITDDKLYQTFALLIKAEKPFSQWKDTYKTFVHPAGMFVGAEIQLVTSVLDLMEADSSKPADPPPIVVENTADLGFVRMNGIDIDGGLSAIDASSLVHNEYVDSPGVGSLQSRINTYLNPDFFNHQSLQYVAKQYSSLRELQTMTSPTFDDSDLLKDSATHESGAFQIGTETGTLQGMDMSNDFFWETLDQEGNIAWSGDSDTYYTYQIDSAGHL